MRRGELWFVTTPGGERPVLVLTRDPVADRIGAVVVAALTRTRRGLVSELELTGFLGASLAIYGGVSPSR
ncbi:type II toxin-antitoxin system PemK/MazF family toxin, partial [Mycobacterium sp.]|uniref:type II toxin-antitoxin system PemK/MazF family toxin n=1 Tax=Mycobacterium sp. TaxID=1785 RepID=UPI00127CFB4E